MAELERPENTDYFDVKRCNDLFSELVAIFQKHHPTVGEILIAYGNLGYTLGASIGQFEGNGPSKEELEKLYYSQPGRLDVALMLQGLLITAWFADWEQLQKQKEQGNRQ